MLDLHVLFASTNAFDPDGNPIPIASLALTLDDEVQYRCAGYIQAEIERYAEFLGDDDDENDDKSELSEAEVGTDEEGAEKSKVKPKKSRKDRMLEHYPASPFVLIFLFIS